MKVSYRSDYALKVLIYLASRLDETVTIQEIASHQDVPIKFLEQILLQLKRGGYVTSKRGARGGYQLSRQANEISVLEILELTEGSLLPIDCATNGDYPSCQESSMCAMQEVFREVAVATCSILGRATIDTLRRRSLELAAEHVTPMYFI